MRGVVCGVWCGGGWPFSSVEIPFQGWGVGGRKGREGKGREGTGRRDGAKGKKRRSEGGRGGGNLQRTTLWPVAMAARTSWCDISPVKYTSARVPRSIEPPEPAHMLIVRIDWDSAVCPCGYATWTIQIPRVLKWDQTILISSVFVFYFFEREEERGREKKKKMMMMMTTVKWIRTMF